MKINKFLILVSSLILPFNPILATDRNDDGNQEYVDALVQRAVKELKVPGIAVAVIKDGRIIHSKGYGVVSADGDQPITGKTLFQVASMTKAFKTAALAILVDEGKLSWDDKLIQHLPDFQMYDPWVTKEFTVKDMLTHRSGLPLGAGDLLQWPKVVSTPKEMLHALRYLKPTSSFRSEYAYDNLMYVVAGEVIQSISGEPWQDFVKSRILVPLNMEGCTARPENIKKPAIRAIPHMEVKDEITTTFSHDGASVNCNVEGMAKWALMHLNKGKSSDGLALLTEKRQEELWKPVTLKRVSRNAKRYSQTHFSAYGLGWNLMDFKGYLHVSHGGAVQGMTSHMAFLPEKNIAVIALTNQWSRAAQGLTATILDKLTFDTPKDYIDMYINSYNRGKAANKKRQEKVTEVASAGAPPTLSFAHYKGTYKDAWYGDIVVTDKNNALHIQFGRTKVLGGNLIHHDKDTFIARWDDRTLNADAYVEFKIDGSNKVRSMSLKAVDRSTDFSYDFHHLDPVKTK